jgi:hypothetical protein
MSMFLMDAMMVGLLIMAIAFCWRLNGRLQNMREMGQEIKPFLKGLGSYITQIAQYIDKLKETSEAAHKNLGNQLPQAIKIKDDFDFMLDHGEQLADRLEKILERAHSAERQLNEIVQRTQRSRPENFTQTVREKNTVESPILQHQAPVNYPEPAPIRQSSEMPLYPVERSQHPYFSDQARINVGQNRYPQQPMPTASAEDRVNERGITSLLRGLR